MLGVTEDGLEASVEFYNRWVEDVKKTVPADKLLVFNVKQGWEPLCKFLGLPIPSNPFPHHNETAEFKKMLNRAKVMSYVFVWIVPSAVVAAVACFWRENLSNLFGF